MRRARVAAQCILGVKEVRKGNVNSNLWFYSAFCRSVSAARCRFGLCYKYIWYFRSFAGALVTRSVRALEVCLVRSA